jgi:hypothetical protein
VDEYQSAINEVMALFRTKKPPAGLLADLVEFESYFTVRVYRDNFDKLALPDQLAAMNWINTTMESIRVLVDCYLEVWRRPGVPE